MGPFENMRGCISKIVISRIFQFFLFKYRLESVFDNKIPRYLIF